MTKSAVVLFCAFLFAATGCQTLCAGRTEPSLSDARIVNARTLLKDHKYQAAIDELENVVSDQQSPSLAPQAKYMIATVYVSTDNPDKDYSEALNEFDEFLRLYPNHELAQDARNWHQALKSILEMKKENERLSKNIERLKQLDVRQEEKRLGR
jgi:outer membrane protein assembly factor BamD (BamD/ComL family)